METNAIYIEDLEHAQCMMTSAEKLELKAATRKKKLPDAMRYAILFFLEWNAAEVEQEVQKWLV